MRTYKVIIAASSLILLASLKCPAAEIKDSAVRYYIDKIDSLLNSSQIFDSNLKYTCEVKSLYHKINQRGEIDKSDTAVYLIMISHGIDSVVNIIDSSAFDENRVPKRLSFARPWNLDCRLYFFPNDTGVGDLAIGFEPVNADSVMLPTGMILLDRISFKIRRIYLYYPRFEDFERLSMVYQFTPGDDNLLLKSLTLQGSFYGFFQRRYFRQIMTFGNYQFH